MKYTESQLEQAFISLLETEGYHYINGKELDRSSNQDVLLREDLRTFLLKRYPDLEEIELERIEKNRILKEKKWALSDEALDEAKTYSDFCTIAKHRGYKTGWAWHRAKQRGVWTPY